MSARRSFETLAESPGHAEKDLEKQQKKSESNCSPEHTPQATLDRIHGSDTQSSVDDKFCVVTLDPGEAPESLSGLRKWTIIFTISIAALCTSCASSMASFTEEGLASDLHTVHEVTILSISLFIEGLGIGPLFVGPLSELYGRNIIYRISYILFWAFTWPTAFPPDIETFLVFRFISGFCGSAFMSVSGGSIGDLFADDEVATPMALFAISPFLGPVMGPLISGFICQNTTWRWVYRVLLIWQFVVIVLLFVVVPETYEPILLKRKAAHLRKTTGDDRYWAPLDRRTGSLAHSILVSCYTPFKLIFYDRMALLLNTWDALILGILYLTFQAFPIIFENVHGFSMQQTGLAFIGIGTGLLLALACQPLWNRFDRKQVQKYSGHPPPEVRLIMGQVGSICAPVGLFWLAFTTYKGVPWIVPIIASVPFGMGVFFIFTSTFTYLVVAYRPIAASAMASNSFMRSTFAAVFPLFAQAMYDKLGTVGATALLAGLATLMTPLPFIYYKIGARLRQTSRFAL